MTKERESRAYITISVAARRTGLSPGTVRRYVRRGLVSDKLTESDLGELRRIRRLRDLGVNLAGVEIILRMRSLFVELQEKAHQKQEIDHRIER